MVFFTIATLAAEAGIVAAVAASHKKRDAAHPVGKPNVAITWPSTLPGREWQSYGPSPKDRWELDTVESGYTIYDSDQISKDGFAGKWEVFAKREGEVKLQVFRRTFKNQNSATFELLHEIHASFPKFGKYEVVLGEHAIKVKKGDFIGFSHYGQCPIPFDTEGRVYRGKLSNTLKEGERIDVRHDNITERSYSMRLWVYDGDSEDPVYVHGDGPVERDHVDEYNSTSNVIIEGHGIPTHGVITNWEFHAKRAGTLNLQVFRWKKDTNFELVGQTNVTVGKTGQYKIKAGEDGIQVKRGDFLGFYNVGEGILTYTWDGGNVIRRTEERLPPPVEGEVVKCPLHNDQRVFSIAAYVTAQGDAACLSQRQEV